MIEGIVFELAFDESFHQCSIATNSHLEVKISECGGFHLTLHVILRVFESGQTCFC